MEDGGEHLSVTLESLRMNAGSPVECTTPCAFQVAQGQYRIEYAAKGDGFAGNETVTIDGDGKVIISPRSRVLRVVGLGVAIAGAGMIAGGYVAMRNSRGWFTGCNDDPSCNRSDSLFGGITLFLSGLVAIPVGLVMFGQTYAHSVELEPLARTPRMTASFDVVPLPGGATIGGTFNF